ncbi:hypothetical protein PIB30_042584 [Stylosanthes scabra]|uniref:Uncharacterized protein n=1 Tax=Stylosanthes scabra TaxID=79078 RepID=A0ABU6TEZ1_9FABA|nr:hypothetical protein [Stylosanthes scabra]
MAVVLPWDRDKGLTVALDSTGKVEDVDDNDNSNLHVFVFHRCGDAESNVRNNRGGEMPDDLKFRWLELYNLVNEHDNLTSTIVQVAQERGLDEKLQRVGVVVQHPNPGEITCGIYFERYPYTKIQIATCGHPYCFSCWAGFISTSINDGPGSDPTHGVVVDQDMINLLALDEDK